MNKKIITGLSWMVLLAGFSSCKKEETKNATTATTIADRLLEQRIVSFYSQMKGAQSSNTSARVTEESMSIDSVEFLAEASYNYYCARLDALSEKETVHFSFSKPASGANELLISTVAEAFWQIKDSLLKTYNSISYDKKQLSLFDLETNMIDGQVIFTVDASFTIAPPESSTARTTGIGETYLTNPANHGWVMRGMTMLPGFGMGQCDIDMSSKEVIAGSKIPTADGALWVLKKQGIRNFNTRYLSPAYSGGTLIVKIDETYTVGPSLISSPLSPYVSMGIPGYTNSNAWSTYIYYTGTLSSSVVNDPDFVFKLYLITGQMNFYLFYIPDFIKNSLPAGKGFVDFNLAIPECIVCPPSPRSDGKAGGQIGLGVYYRIKYSTVTSVKLSPPISIAYF